MKTMTNAVVIKVLKLICLSKSLKPLPEKYHGLADAEERYRRRYVDLIVNSESREKFIKRIKITQWIKDYFNNLGYLDVETPFLHDYISGAAAKPFSTHHNSLNQDFVLRIATEIPLKKLVIGGFDRVYELGRIFRMKKMIQLITLNLRQLNSIEDTNAEGMMNRTEDLLKYLCNKLGKHTL